MTAVDTAVTFACGAEQLVGVLTSPPTSSRRGLLIVVGGPQYRVGSHRQFLLLARYLAARGIPVFRFDHRGMGDSTGEVRSFEALDEDLRSAIDAFCSAHTGLREIVIWGLCDAASAALMYAHRDARVRGLVLVNPWVRSEAGLARAYVKHYYARRLLAGEFWRKFATGEVEVGAALAGFFSQAKRAAANDVAPPPSFIDRMAQGLASFEGRILCVLSGQDLTAQEFRQLLAESPDWRKRWQAARVALRELPEANHTFASRAWRDQVAHWTVEWLAQW